MKSDDLFPYSEPSLNPFALKKKNIKKKQRKVEKLRDCPGVYIRFDH